VSDLASEVMGQLQGEPLQQLAASLGIDPGTAEQAISSALPAVLGGLAANTASAEGADSLHAALADHSGAQPLGDLGSLLSGVLGGGIINHTLGSALNPVADAIAARTGLKPEQVRTVLAAVAPVVMAAIAKRASGKGSNAAQVAEDVQADSATASQQMPDLGSILGGLLGR